MTIITGIRSHERRPWARNWNWHSGGFEDFYALHGLAFPHQRRARNPLVVLIVCERAMLVHWHIKQLGKLSTTTSSRQDNVPRTGIAQSNTFTNTVMVVHTASSFRLLALRCCQHKWLPLKSTPRNSPEETHVNEGLLMAKNKAIPPWRRIRRRARAPSSHGLNGCRSLYTSLSYTFGSG